MVMNIKSLSAFFILVLLAGCQEDTVLPTVSITTVEIFPLMRSVQYEDGSVLTTVELHNFAGTYLYLSDGDQLLASLNAPPEQFTSFNDNLFSNAQLLSNRVNILEERYLYTDYGLFFSDVTYGTPEYFTLDNADGLSLPTRSYVTFNRSSQKSATDSWVKLPPVFSILNPAANDVISRTGTITLQWSDFDNISIMKLDVGAVCDGIRYTANLNFGIVDTGTIVLSATDYFTVAPPPTSSCSVSFLLKRQNLGVVSYAFGGGSFEGIQQRTVRFTSTP